MTIKSGNQGGVSMEIKGLKEIHDRMRNFPKKYSRAAKKTLEAALLHVQGSVPSYPPAPKSSWYVRTGTLGRSLGSSMGGQPVGKADIQQVKPMGGYQEAQFGTRLHYAPRVIGDATQQEAPWRSYWWNINTILAKAKPGVIKLFQKMAEMLARWLDGKGV